MFKSSDGLFHFVFANQEDYFFTDSYLKLNFKPYLYYCLQKSGYEHIYSLYKKKDSCFLRAIGNADSENQKNENSIFSVFNNIFSVFNKDDKSEKKDYISGFFENSMEISAKECSDAINDILRFMDRNESTAFIVPLNIFCELFNTKNIIKQLGGLNSSNNNIIVITSSCLSADNDKYFIFSKDTNAPPSIFYQRNNEGRLYNFFREFSAYENENRHKIIFTYDVLKSAFGERVQYWNRLDYSDILKIVNYNIMHGEWNYYSPELYSAVISAWYGNRKFRNKYCDILRLPENTMRTNKIVYDIIKNNIIKLKDIKEIIRQEQTADFRKILEKWGSPDSIFISKVDSCDDLEYDKSAGGYIFLFNKIFASHSEISQERKDRLLETETFFLKSSYKSPEIHHYLPHQYLSGINNDFRYQKIIDNAYSMLKNQTKWNWWHIYMAEMIIEMFLDCKELAEYSPNNDIWGDEISMPCFQVWLKGIDEFVEKSGIYPDYTEERVKNHYNAVCAIAESRAEYKMKQFIGNSFSN